MIAVVDYGAGNLASVRKALSAVGADVFTPETPQALARASAIVVPGVGHFDRTKALDAAWRDAIFEAIGGGAPLLGICVGLQWLFEGSAEAPDVAGLGLFPGRCQKLPAAKVPHVGWNSLSFPRESPLMAGVPEGAQVYFTHSYAAPIVEDAIAVTTYEVPFTAAVERGQISGVQFHPEKSGDVGLRVLRNWVRR